MPVKLDDRNPISNADVLITIEGLPGYWSEFSGVKKKYSRPKFSDGLSATKRTASSGSGEFENVTIKKAFDPEKDDAVFEFLKSHECGEVFDMSVRPVKRCRGMEFRGNKGYSISGCRVESYEVMADMDTGSGEEVAMIVIEFSVEDAAWSGAKANNPSFGGVL